MAASASGRGVFVVDELLSDLEIVAKTPSRQRSVNAAGLVDKLCLNLYQTGLSNHSLSTLIDIITLPNELDQASLTALIRNLYPAGKVPDNIVINVVASLGHGITKPSHNTQNGLLRWLILVYDDLENQKILSELYAVLFNLLDTLALRAQLCHLLSLITRRKHVRPFRIQFLMELTRQLGGVEAPVVGLLRVYKDYYPDVIIGDVVSGRASVFTRPNDEWWQHLSDIQSSQAPSARNKRDKGFKVARQSQALRKSSQAVWVPEVHTSNASADSKTLDEIEGVLDFVDSLETIEPPNQLVAVISDPLLQKFLQLRSLDEYVKRVDMWLSAFFEDQLQSSAEGDTRILRMLEGLLGYTQYTKVLPDPCLLYLRSMLPYWNGVMGRDIILDLLTYVQPRSFDELLQNYLEPMQDAILEDTSVGSRLMILTFYKNLLGNWASLATCQPEKNDDTIAAMNSLVQNARTLCLNIIQISQHEESVSAILEFYEAVTATISNTQLKSRVRITTPFAELVYTLHFNSSVSTVSRLCAVLASYKRAFEGAMTPKSPGSKDRNAQTYDKDYVNHFNGFLMDICNCLWRARALNNGDPNALGCLIDRRVAASLTTYVGSLDTSLTLPSLFSFSTSPTLCLLAIKYVRELEDANDDKITKRHAGPVTQASLKQLEIDGGLILSWQDYKLGVLRHLEGIGVPGVGELMYNTMKHLMSARSKKE